MNFYTFTLLAQLLQNLHFYAFTPKTQNFYATPRLCVLFNNIGSEGEKALKDAVKGREGFDLQGA